MSAKAMRPRLDPATVRAALPYFVLAAALAFLAWCTITTATKPGLEMDEVLFVNAASGRPTGADAFLGVPTMVFPYIGALKSWLYVPVFDLFGVTAKTIRLPMIGVELLTVMLGFLLARRMFGVWLAALLALLLATDPTYMTAAKADWGPIALATLLRLGALFAYVSWLRTERGRWLWLLVVAIALGAWNKLDFLLFAGAFAVAALVVHHRALWAIARRRAPATAAPFVALVAFLFLLYVEVVRPAGRFPVAESHVALAQRIQDIWGLVYQTFNGSTLYLDTTAKSLPNPTLFLWFLVACLAGGAGTAFWWAAWGRRRPQADGLAAAAQTTTFLFVLFAAMFVVMVFARQVNGPHHALQLWPIPQLLGVGLIAVAARLPGKGLRTAATAGLAAGALVLAATQVRAADEFHAAFTAARNWHRGWTTEIYPLSAAINHAAATPDVDSVVTADWGTGNQLSALGTDTVRTKLDDAWPTFLGLTGPHALKGAADTLFRGKNVLLVAPATGTAIMKDAGVHARQLLAAVHARHGVRALYRGRLLVLFRVDDRA